MPLHPGLTATGHPIKRLPCTSSLRHGSEACVRTYPCKLDRREETTAALNVEENREHHHLRTAHKLFSLPYHQTPLERRSYKPHMKHASRLFSITLYFETPQSEKMNDSISNSAPDTPTCSTQHHAPSTSHTPGPRWALRCSCTRRGKVFYLEASRALIGVNAPNR